MHCAVLRCRCAARASLRLMYGELAALGRSLGEARRVSRLELATTYVICWYCAIKRREEVSGTVQQKTVQQKTKLDCHLLVHPHT